VGDLVADNVMFIADIHNTDGIWPLKMIIVCLMATNLITPCSIDDQQLAYAMQQTAAHVLGRGAHHEDVTRMVLRIQEKSVCGYE
jgi:hypothetical protein